MPAAAPPPAPSQPQPSSRPLVEIRDLRRGFVEGGRERTVLRGAWASIRRGELAVLVGRSGSGKSTLLNLLAGIDLPDAGEVVIDGVSIARLRERDRTLFRRDHIGFVLQFFNLIPTLTVEENLLLPLELKGSLGAAERRRALDLLAEVGLADRARSFPDQLSGGEQQRVAMARALAHDPLLVLADEPTGNLDLETGLQVLDLLDRLTRRAGKTMVMVTHSPEVVGIADRVFGIEDCRLVERTGGAVGRTEAAAGGAGAARAGGAEGATGTAGGTEATGAVRPEPRRGPLP
jgi:putative ABC transport system ATP-binding protein